ncbi:MAG: adenosylcobinamide-phosphate synthase CbiB [Desulfosalsimonadaceae bacterium]|nr:adenosylcobinamide-phosphate synthase CbiB [Desulfosalsimonadaceae bacterium]
MTGIHIILAFCLDLLIGDPPRLPHPVRWIGRYAAVLEDITCRRMSGRGVFGQQLAGCMVVFTVIVTAGGSVWLIFLVLGAVFPPGRDLFAIWVLYSGLATRDLADHAFRVRAYLYKNDLPRARQAVAMVVGRDTASMDATEIARAAVESVGENMVDGVTAPLMAMLAFGPVGAMVYKAASTMDSMFGYRNERYRHFGWCAARLDDLLTFLPARLTLPCVMVAAWILKYDALGAARVAVRDWKKHESPNSAWGEAAMAGGINVTLGGPATYGGISVERPFIGSGERILGPDAITQSVRLMRMTAVVCLIVGIFLRVAG